MRAKFPLFQSHLDLAHHYWSSLLIPGDTVIDATCGNGHNTLVLYNLVGPSGKVYAFDIQENALENTKSLLPSNQNSVFLIHASHATFPEAIQDVKLVVYNLGYLPRGDKAVTTKTESTIQSIIEAQKKIIHGGAICITCYPGHEEGAQEEAALINFCQKLDPLEWNVCHHRLLNRNQAPSLILLQKKLN